MKMFFIRDKYKNSFLSYVRTSVPQKLLLCKYFHFHSICKQTNIPCLSISRLLCIKKGTFIQLEIFTIFQFLFSWLINYKGYNHSYFFSKCMYFQWEHENAIVVLYTLLIIWFSIYSFNNRIWKKWH